MSSWVAKVFKTRNFAILCLTIYGIACLIANINHLVVFSIASAVAGIAGYEIKRLRGP